MQGNAGQASDLNLHVANVPPLGYKVVWAGSEDKGAAKTSDMHEESNAFTLGNESLRVAIDKSTGCIKSISDKHSGFETLAKGGCGNQLQFCLLYTSRCV